MLLLGAPDRQIKENEITTWETNKIGGSPDWFREGRQPPCCACCQREMNLVTQIYCPQTDSPYHRCLHIFVCPTKVCSKQRQGWRVVRTQLLSEKPTQRNNNSSTKDTFAVPDDWGVNQDDWGEDEDDLDEGQKDSGLGADQRGNLASMTDTDAAAQRLAGMTVDGATSFSTITVQGTSRVSECEPAKSESSGSRLYAEVLSKSSGGDKREERTDLDSQDTTAGTSDAEGCEVMEEVEGEAVAVSVQRMMGLLATPQDCGDSQQSGVNEREKTSGVLFPAYYLEVFAESEVEEEISDHVTTLLKDYERREGKKFTAILDDYGKSPSGADAEKYDKTEVKHGDKLCYKFIKRLQVYPQQCIRYQWNGSPLWMTEQGGALMAERCQRCGSPRVFELQLVPPLIPLLKLPGQAGWTVEFGTVLVFTCSQSCWSDDDVWREESILLQHDPDHHRFT